MSKEVERKWLADLSEIDLLPPGHYIKQAHVVVTKDRDVRVRSRESPDGRKKEWTLTVKKGTGENREEIDSQIGLQTFSQMKEGREGRLIKKRRHVLEMQGHEVEVDVYQGELEGLVVAEVEDPEGFEPPEWFGLEVTEDERYKNKWLAVQATPTATVSKRRPMRTDG